MPSNAELEIAVRKLTAEVAALKASLDEVFDCREIALEVRRKWNELTRPPVEVPSAEPKPPGKGEAQRHLEYLESFQQIFERNKEK